MKKDLLGIDDLTRDEIYLILDFAEAMREIGQRPIKEVPTLRGKTIVNLFYEPSTRTRTSFEIAEKRLWQGGTRGAGPRTGLTGLPLNEPTTPR